MAICSILKWQMSTCIIISWLISVSIASNATFSNDSYYSIFTASATIVHSQEKTVWNEWHTAACIRLSLIRCKMRCNFHFWIMNDEIGSSKSQIDKLQLIQMICKICWVHLTWSGPFHLTMEYDWVSSRKGERESEHEWRYRRMLIAKHLIGSNQRRRYCADIEQCK